MIKKNLLKIIFLLILVFNFSSCESEKQNNKEIIKNKIKSTNVSIGENSNNIELASNKKIIDGLESKTIEVKNELLVEENNFSENEFNNFGNIGENNEDAEEFEKFGKEDNDDEIKEEKIDCNEHYNELLNKFKGDYSDCNFLKEDIGICNGQSFETGKVNLVIVFDDSGSMGAKIGNEKMIDIAKKSINKYIGKINLSDTNLGLVLYGHRGKAGRAGKVLSCRGIEEVMSLGDKNKSGTLSRINELTANGWTPIDRSLRKAKKMINDFAKPKDKNIILLVSDGKESCQGNPLETAKNISDGKNQIKIDVIGFNVEGETRNELLKISSNGGGKYFDVKNELEFEKTFNSVKTFLKKMECGANKAAQELEQGVKAINTYFTCRYKIKEEEAMIYTSMNKECKKIIRDNLKIRHKKLENKFKDLEKEGNKILKNFSKNMTKIKEEIK